LISSGKTGSALTKEDTPKVIGIIFPVLPHHLPRFFENHKTVFVKFVGRHSLSGQIHRGSKLFFYESMGNKEVVGEARIVEVSTGTMDEVLARHGDELFLTRTELEQYAGNRRAQRMLVLVLQDVKKYKVHFRLGKGLTMAGQYMTKAMYLRLSERE
jgi:hypothetical protein